MARTRGTARRSVASFSTRPVPEPVAEQAQEPVAEQVAEQVAETVPEQVAEPVQEPVIDYKTWTVSNLKKELEKRNIKGRSFLGAKGGMVMALQLYDSNKGAEGPNGPEEWIKKQILKKKESQKEEITETTTSEDEIEKLSSEVIRRLEVLHQESKDVPSFKVEWIQTLKKLKEELDHTIGMLGASV